MHTHQRNFPKSVLQLVFDCLLGRQFLAVILTVKGLVFILPYEAIVKGIHGLLIVTSLANLFPTGNWQVSQESSLCSVLYYSCHLLIWTFIYCRYRFLTDVVNNTGTELCRFTASLFLKANLQILYRTQASLLLHVFLTTYML